MKKLLVVVAVLALLAGAAYAADLNDGLTRNVYAHGKARTVVSDSSVALSVWYAGDTANNPLVVVTGNTTVGFHDTINGVVPIDTTNLGSYDSVQEVVDFINAHPPWYASVGNDVTPGTVAFGMLAKTTAAPGTNERTAYTINKSCNTNNTLGCGVKAVTNKVIRLRKIVDRAGGNGAHKLSIWDGSTEVWRWDVTQVAFASTNANSCSPHTVDFSSIGSNGLAMSPGNKLTVTGYNATSSGDVTNKIADNNISIEWDEF